MPTISSYTAERISEIEAGTIVGGTVDVNGDLILTRFDGVEINAGSVIGPTGPTGQSVIAHETFDPDPVISVEASTAAWADIDSSLEIGFNAPASGKVEVELNGFCFLKWGVNQYHWGIREGGVQVGKPVSVLQRGTIYRNDAASSPPFGSGFVGGTVVETNTGGQRVAKIIVEGLTPGSPHVYRWAHKLASATGYNAIIYVGSITGQNYVGTMKVTALP